MWQHEESKSMVSKQKIKLNRHQILKLVEIVNQFIDVEEFTIETDESSGIGVGVVVSFSLFSDDDAKIDISDVKEW